MLNLLDEEEVAQRKESEMKLQIRWYMNRVIGVIEECENRLKDCQIVADQAIRSETKILLNEEVTKGLQERIFDLLQGCLELEHVLKHGLPTTA